MVQQVQGKVFEECLTSKHLQECPQALQPFLVSLSLGADLRHSDQQILCLVTVVSHSLNECLYQPEYEGQAVLEPGSEQVPQMDDHLVSIGQLVPRVRTTLPDVDYLVGYLQLIQVQYISYLLLIAAFCTLVLVFTRYSHSRLKHATKYFSTSLPFTSFVVAKFSMI